VVEPGSQGRVSNQQTAISNQPDNGRQGTVRSGWLLFVGVETEKQCGGLTRYELTKNHPDARIGAKSH
jgi:hypothetical protein